jgi:hypothetical protein
MYSDVSIHTNDSIICIPKKILKNTYIRATAEKEAEIMKRKALEEKYGEIIKTKKIESDKVSHLEKNLDELKKEIDEYKSSSSNKKIKTETETKTMSENLRENICESTSEYDSSDDSSNDSSDVSSDDGSNDSSNDDSNASTSPNISVYNNNREQNINYVEKIKKSEQIIKENKEKLVDEYYKKHYASKINMLKKKLEENN